MHRHATPAEVRLRSLGSLAMIGGLSLLAAAQPGLSADGPPALATSGILLPEALVPAEVLAAGPAATGPEATWERGWVSAFELEVERRDGPEVERFLDASGRELFRFVAEGGAGGAHRETCDVLPDAARRTLREVAGAHRLDGCLRESEWGRPVHSVRWHASEGRRELKVLDDGRPLFLETGDPIPELIVEIAGSTGEEIESLLLGAYRRVDGASGEVMLFLSTGLRLRPPEGSHGHLPPP